MTRAYTDYPRQTRFAHLAPVMGAVPIFGPRAGEGIPFRGAFAFASAQPGTTAGDSMDPSVVGPPTTQNITPTSATAPTAPSAEIALGAGTAALAGAAVGGVAGGSWRGAGIGAGMNVGLWSAITVAGHWGELTPGSKGLLLGSSLVGLALAGVLVAMRAKG